MANQGSGLGKGLGGIMKDPTSFNARDGAAKKPQTSFDVHPGMTDNQRKQAGISPDNPGTGPDASSPNPLANAPQSGGEDGTPLKASWDMKDANGKGVDNAIGGKVLGEAILSGASKLPASESYSTGGPGKP